MLSEYSVYIVVAVAAAIAILPNLYWATRRRLLRRRGWLDVDAFLAANNFDPSDVARISRAHGLRQRLKSVGSRLYIDGESAALISEKMAELKAARALETRNNLQNAALAAGAGAAIAAATAVTAARDEKSKAKVKTPQELEREKEREKERQWDRGEAMDFRNMKGRVKRIRTMRVRSATVRVWQVDDGRLGFTGLNDVFPYMNYEYAFERDDRDDFDPRSERRDAWMTRELLREAWLRHDGLDNVALRRVVAEAIILHLAMMPAEDEEGRFWMRRRRL